MSGMSHFAVPDPDPELSRKTSVVGLGESDFHLDYQAARARSPDYAPPTAESLAITAFERALADSGLRREEIDGLSVNFLYGGPDAGEMATMLGLAARHIEDKSAGICAGPIPAACLAIAQGRCDTVALIFSVATRSIGRKFGGQTFGEGAPLSYYYHHPWGWSSQAAHWALIWTHYQQTYGATEADLGAVAVQLRDHASRNANAVMQKLLTIDDYLASRYIVRPLHLLDMCLVNDGAVCLIVRRADRAKGLPHVPVDIGGWGRAAVKGNKMHALVRERMRPQYREAGRQALDMAGIALSDIEHFEGYDASTIHLIDHLEGHGFVEPGSGLEFCKSGGMAIGGALPVNTGGGILSGSYMHGWSHVAEIVRQLRHEAGPRQIADVSVSMFSLAQTDQVHPLVFMRGDI
jgi:acetyl-CoA acetyltransferase